MKKHKKNVSTFKFTVETFIKELEMNIQFGLNNNIYNSFMTIHQSGFHNSKSNDDFRMVRLFYYFDEEEYEMDIVEDEEYIDIKDLMKKGKMQGNLKNSILLLKDKGEEDEKDEDEDDDEEKKEETNRKNNDKLKMNNKKNKMMKKDNNIKNKKTNKKENKKEIFNKWKKRNKNYIDFNQDITFYYYIDKDNNELIEEYGFENNKLRIYEADDLEEETIDDIFMEHCEDIYNTEKIALNLSEDYFDYEFEIWNILKIDNKVEKTGLGEYLRLLWKSNRSISNFDKYLNYIVNRIIIMDKYLKYINDEEDSDVIKYLKMNINKENDIDQETKLFMGKLDLEFGIVDKWKYTGIHEVGVFLKNLLNFMIILDRTTASREREDRDNELRFDEIKNIEYNELEDVIGNFTDLMDSILLDERYMREDNEQKKMIEELKPDIESILFGMKIILLNRYMSEHLNEYYFNIEYNEKDSLYVKKYDEIKDDFKMILQNKMEEKELEKIIMKWNYLSDIREFYDLIVGNIIKLV